MITRLVEDLGEQEFGSDDIAELRGLLYGLYAVLRLHFAQEDETYLSLRGLQPAGLPGPDARLREVPAACPLAGSFRAERLSPAADRSAILDP